MRLIEFFAIKIKGRYVSTNYQTWIFQNIHSKMHYKFLNTKKNACNDDFYITAGYLC